MIVTHTTATASFSLLSVIVLMYCRV